MNSTALTATVQPNLDVNYIGMDVHSDNVVVCVRRNTIKLQRPVGRKDDQNKEGRYQELAGTAGGTAQQVRRRAAAHHDGGVDVQLVLARRHC